MSKIIAVIDTGYNNYAYEHALLHENNYSFKIFPGDIFDHQAKIDFSRDALGLFVRWTEVNDDFLRNYPNLKVIVRYGTGYENIDLAAATRAGVKVSNVTGYANHAVSDHALALIYASLRGLFPGNTHFDKIFGRAPFKRVFEVHKKTLGIIGLGRIGGTLAGKAVHLFKHVVAYDPYISDERFKKLGVKKVQLDKLLAESDVISLHCNLTQETRNLLDTRTFGKMKRVPIIINTSRGPVVQTGALLDALNADKIHSAGLDVFESENVKDIPKALTTHPGIITTGHYAWYSENSLKELQRRAAHNMLDLLLNKKPEDGLN